jgi:hypothetical protein
MVCILQLLYHNPQCKLLFFYPCHCPVHICHRTDEAVTVWCSDAVGQLGQWGSAVLGQRFRWAVGQWGSRKGWQWGSGLVRCCGSGVVGLRGSGVAGQWL